MTDYTDLGFDAFLNTPTASSSGSQQSDLAFDQVVSQFSGSKIDENSMPGSSILDESITNKKISLSNRVATAIVSQAADADFGDIQKALDYVNAQGGGKVLVLPGTYRIINPLTIYSDTIIEGISTNDCILDFNNTINNFSTANKATDISITRLHFKNCANSTFGTIYLDNTSRINIQECLFNNNSIDIFTSKAGRTKIEKNITGNQTKSAIFYKASSNSTISWITDNEIYSGTTNAIVNGGQAIIRNNFFSGQSMTIFSGSFSFAIIQGNVVFNFAGTYFAELNNSSFCFLTDNYTTGCISLSGCPSCNIKGNYFSERANSTPIIYLTNSSNCSLTGNRIGSGSASNLTGVDGIKIITSSNRNTITGNVIFEFCGGTSYTYNIASVECTSNVLVGNYFFAPSGGNDTGTGSVIANNG